MLVDPGHWSPDDFAQSISTLIPDALAEVRGPGVLVACSELDLDAVRSIVEYAQFGDAGWVVGLSVFETSRSFSRAFGLQYAASGGLDASLSPTGFDTEWAVAASVLFDAAATSSEVELVSRAMLYLIEGEEAVFSRGDVLRIPRRTVSPEGTSTVVSFDQINTGFQVRVNGRGVPGGLLLSADVSVSDVVGFVDVAPTVAERSTSGAVFVTNGDRVLFSGLESLRAVKSADESGLPLGRKSSENDERTLYIVFDVNRVHTSRPAPRRSAAAIGGGALPSPGRGETGEGSGSVRPAAPQPEPDPTNENRSISTLMESLNAQG